MAKTLYLHIGMPKCASTTIQNVLHTHADVFAANGKFYGRPADDKTNGQGNAARLVYDIRKEKTGRVDKTLAFFLNRETDVILSSEVLVALGHSSHAKSLVESAAAKGFDTQVIVYVRRQDLWIESDYKQHVKGTSVWSDDIETLIARRKKTRVLDYYWLIERWAKGMSRDKITVVPLLDGQGELYALERFLTFVGMDPALAPVLATARQNISPSVALIEPMRFFKGALLAKGLSPVEALSHIDWFRQELQACVTLPKRRFLLPLAKRRALLETYAGSNKLLSDAYLGGQQVFDDHLDEDTVPVVPLAEEAARILADYIVFDKGAPELFKDRLWAKIRRKLRR
ncbi:hypothetical protein [Sulfitobacter sp.]|uniref:hypothetical protein n=1 Tax=Sulfitobacter sp. TaxID=1903071 RepID=UPI003EF3FE19